MLVYLQKKMLVIFLLGLASGLPLVLSASSLSVMLLDRGVDISTIGVLSMVALPYSFKYLWSPFLDHIKIYFLTNLLGRRISWLLVIQICLFFSIYHFGSICAVPDINLWQVGLWAMSISFFSATQDMVINSYRIEISNEIEQAAASASEIFGYRIGMLIAGAGNMLIAHYWSWEVAYHFSAVLILPGLIAAMLYGEPKNQYMTHNKKEFAGVFVWFKDVFLTPLFDILRYKNFYSIIGLIIFYKLSDAYIGAMSNVFLVQTGFSKAEIGSIGKLYGFVATTLGVFFAGIFMKKITDMKRLLVIGLTLESTSNLVFLLQYMAGCNIKVLMLVVTMENFCSGFSTIVFVAYMSSLVNREFTATSYALLTSLASFSRVLLSSSSGFAVKSFGWAGFFIFSAFLSIPAAFCIYNLYFKKQTYPGEEI